MIRYDMAQRAPEWRAIRCGKLTASDAKDMLATIKTGEAAARRDLRATLVAERLTGRSQDEAFVNDAMQHGIDTEDAARRCYEAERGDLVTAVGFLARDELAAGCSPDGLVGDGLLELKCPKTATHLTYMRDPSALVATYKAQLTHALWVSGAPWIDVASFDNRLTPNLQFVVVRLERTAVDLAAHEAAARKFLTEVDLDVASLQGWGVLREIA